MTGKGRGAKMKIMATLSENIYRTTKIFGDKWNKPKVCAAKASVRRSFLTVLRMHLSRSTPPAGAVGQVPLGGA